jgi:hypothetical protein
MPASFQEPLNIIYALQTDLITRFLSADTNAMFCHHWIRYSRCLNLTLLNQPVLPTPGVLFHLAFKKQRQTNRLHSQSSHKNHILHKCLPRPFPGLLPCHFDGWPLTTAYLLRLPAAGWQSEAAYEPRALNKNAPLLQVTKGGGGEHWLSCFFSHLSLMFLSKTLLANYSRPW